MGDERECSTLSRSAMLFAETTDLMPAEGKQILKRMQWTERGTHLLLPTRTKVLNGHLEETFRGWRPAFRQEAEKAAT
jgi:hypothetical protein